MDKNGRVTVKGAGEAVITATTVSGGLTAQVTINGNNEEAAATDQAGTVAGNSGPAADNGQVGNGQSGSGVYRIHIAGSAGASGQTTGAAVQQWRSQGMSKDAVALPEIETDNPLTRFTLMALAFLFAAGILGRFIIYWLEV